MLPKINPTQTNSWKELLNHKNRLEKTSIQQLFKDSKTNRFEEFHIENDGILLDFSKNKLDAESFQSLLSLAEECKLKNAIQSMFGGEIINETEQRAVLHPLLRYQNRAEYKNINDELFDKIDAVKKQMQIFSDAVINKTHLGFTGKPITNVINIGIGGSDLGPRFVCDALKNYNTRLKVHFVSNVDASDILQVLEKVNPETSLFLIASKTFTTDETMTNAHLAKKWFLHQVKDEKAIEKHFVALSTATEKAQEFGIKKENIFEMWDWVGGRFSLWGSVGLSICLAVGYTNFELLLKGSNKMDQHFTTASFGKNIPVILALISIWYNNFWNYSSYAVLSYDANLKLLVSFLQQMEMESNGKYIDRNNEKIDYQTNPIIWGETGTDAQHAFFQLLHQGTKIAPADFLVAKSTSHKEKESHKKLLSNFLAQTQALAFGNLDKKDSLSSHKIFEGNRPSNSIVYNELSPEILGKLIAMYEHKVFVQGVIWNIFSFDQWGVELGKVIAKSIYEEIKVNNTSNFDDSTNGLMRHLV